MNDHFGLLHCVGKSFVELQGPLLDSSTAIWLRAGLTKSCSVVLSVYRIDSVTFHNMTYMQQRM